MQPTVKCAGVPQKAEADLRAYSLAPILSELKRRLRIVWSGCCIAVSAISCRFDYEVLDTLIEPNSSDPSPPQPSGGAGDASSAGAAGTLSSGGSSGALSAGGSNAATDAGPSGGGATQAVEAGSPTAQAGSPTTEAGSPTADASTPTNDAASPAPDASSPPEGDTQAGGVLDSLRHRYSFDGTGTLVVDSVGGADGQLINAALDGSGQVSLAGGASNQYVDLPNGLISSLTSLTVEVWAFAADVESGGYQRFFDFGNNTAGEDGDGDATTALSVAIHQDFLRTLFDADPAQGGTGWRATFGPALATGDVYLAVTLDAQPGNQLLSTFVDGALWVAPASVPDGEGLADIDDVNVWLGRAQHHRNFDFNGRYLEFRIWDAALTADQIASHAVLGPDTLPP